jgi:hypothetical protein
MLGGRGVIRVGKSYAAGPFGPNEGEDNTSEALCAVTSIRAGLRLSNCWL